MNEIKINRPNIEQLRRIGKLVAEQVLNETGATVEITFTKEVLVYTEDLDKAEAVVELMKAAGRSLISVSEYEAEEMDGELLPAGATYSFTY